MTTTPRKGLLERYLGILQLDAMILKAFSNLNDSTVLLMLFKFG